jgi:predicted dehydrogenase/nucleoside-diphosphate-sugar epimerase
MSEASTRIRVGFLGTGYIADWHAKALRSVRGAALVAVCDRDLSRARAFGESQGVTQVYTSLSEMLAATKLDAVHVLLPPEHHYQAAREAIDAGVHVLLEKPMCSRAEDCEALIQAANQKRVKIGVGHNFLFGEVYEQLKADLTAGRLGRPDHIVITWNKPLGQLTAGPFDIWMLRAPENIMLEVGPHSVAHLWDLVGQHEIVDVRTSNPVDLPGGGRFYRRWQIDADHESTRVSLVFSFAPGFSEHTIHVRGSLAAATADFENDTYVLHRHTPKSLDFDRYARTTSEGAALRRQARRNLARYALARFKLSDKGSPYASSIAGALRAFYDRPSDMPDPRVSPQMGRDVVATCIEIGRRAGLTRPEPSPSPAVPTSAGSRPEILILGATGFIGRELARQLIAKGLPIRVLVRNASRLPDDLRGPMVDVVKGDAGNGDDFERALDGISCVYHLARAQAKTWRDYYEHDVLVTKQIAETCLKRGVKRLIYTGTIDSYYAGAQAGTITEQTPLDPQIARRNKYARAKAASEDLLMSMNRQQRLPLVIFRPGIVIGRGSSPLHWGVGMWSWGSVCQLWGKGTHGLPLVLVQDVASALVAALDAPGIEGESFNLVAAPCLSGSDYLKELEGAAGVEFRKIPTSPWKFYTIDMFKWFVKTLVRHPERDRPSYRDWETRTQRAHFDCSKARQRLGWKPIDDRRELVRRGIQEPAQEFLG